MGTSFLILQAWFLESLTSFLPAWPLWAMTYQVRRKNSESNKEAEDYYSGW